MTEESPVQGTPEQAADPSQDDGATTTEHVHEEVDVDYDVEVPNVRPGARTGLDHDPLRAKPSTLAGRAAPVQIPANDGPADEPEAVPEPTPEPEPHNEENGQQVPGTVVTDAPDAGTGEAVNDTTGEVTAPGEQLPAVADQGVQDAVTPDGENHDGGVVNEQPADPTVEQPTAITGDAAQVVDPSQAVTDPGAGTDAAAETTSGESPDAGAPAEESAPAADSNDASSDAEKRMPPTDPPA